jgi:methylglyoxal synthase
MEKPTERPRVMMSPHKHIALVAHDSKKDDLLEWATHNLEILKHHSLYATGTTGKVLSTKLNLAITRMQSGPLGGDQQLGARIVDGEIDVLVFFWDPLEAQPHDPDVRALLRIAAVWNIPVATNRATADFLISSPLMSGNYERLLTEYYDYRTRLEPKV